MELRLVSPAPNCQRRQSGYVESCKVYQNLIWLNGVVNSGAGDVAGGADERPTDRVGRRPTRRRARAERAPRRRTAEVLDRDVAARYNRAAAGRGLRPVG